MMKKLFTTALALFFISVWSLGFNVAASLAAGDQAAKAAPRIVGGVKAEDGAWPFIAGILHRAKSDPYNAQFCGGALIAPQWVLTAAHCTEGEKAGDLDVFLGSNRLEAGQGERINVDRIVDHPDYDKSTLNNDVALLHLEEPSTQTPIDIIEQGDPDNLVKEGEMTTIMGWGNTSSYISDYPRDLMQVSVPIADQALSNATYQMIGYTITANMFAAGYQSGGKDSCQGDSGGPLVMEVDGQWRQVGVTSWGEGCGLPDYPGVYAKLSRYADWIEDQTGGSSATNHYFPHVDAAGQWTTEICLVNKSASENLTGLLKAYSDSGSQVGSSKTVNISPRGRKSWDVATDFQSPASIGYVVFEATGGTAAGYTKFSIPGTYRVAVPLAESSSKSTLYVPHIDSSTEWWTGLSLVNTTSSSKTAHLIFDTGASYSVKLAAGEHYSFTIADVFGGQPQPLVGSAQITSAAGVVGLELFGRSSQLSGVLLSGESTKTMYYPHVTSEDGWWTGIVAYNPDTSRIANLIIDSYSQSGEKLGSDVVTVQPASRMVGTPATLSLPSGAAWLEVTATRAVTGLELFGTEAGTQLGGYSVLGLARTSGVFPKLEQDGWTGIALVNTTGNSATVTLNARSDSGTLVAQRTLSLDPYEKNSQSAEDLFQGQSLTGATYVEFSSNREVAGFQLNGSADGMLLDALPGM